MEFALVLLLFAKMVQCPLEDNQFEVKNCNQKKV